MNKQYRINMSRRSFLAHAASLSMTPAVLNAGLGSAGLLWTRGALAADAGTAPKRLVTIHVTNGAHPGTWHAQGTGTDFTLPQGSSPFNEEGIRERCVFFDGLNGAGGHGHHHQCVSNGQKTSLDIYAASKLSADTPYSSLHLAAFPEGALSRVNGNGIPFELHPMKVYDRMFPEPIADGGRDWKTIRRNAIFNANLKSLEEFKQKLNPVQKERVELHSDSIQAMGKRVQRAALAANGGGECTRPFWDGLVSDTALLDKESLAGAATVLRSKLSMDLIALAFKCDLTRVATFSFGHSQADVMLPFGDSWHDCQHGYRNGLKNPQGRKFFSEQMVYLMKLLADAPDSDGRSILDNTLIYLTSDMGNGSSHNNSRHPIVLAGGLVNGGQAKDMGGIFWDPIFDTVAAAIGIQLDDPDYPNFGNGAGVIDGVIKA